jgi:hypothetical protein
LCFRLSSVRKALKEIGEQAAAVLWTEKNVRSLFEATSDLGMYSSQQRFHTYEPGDEGLVPVPHRKCCVLVWRSKLPKPLLTALEDAFAASGVAASSSEGSGSDDDDEEGRGGGGSEGGDGGEGEPGSEDNWGSSSGVAGKEHKTQRRQGMLAMLAGFAGFNRTVAAPGSGAAKK